ncbi:hypothetical protein BayCH28_18980 [Mycolicibacterium sp. CH28]|uniref:hypothetical protein n=1 Tax=Mycolicibacterium sp. CH28 TaxID=2512237 RepID=UPI0010819C6A|nr:hypothetical protein [Mycolicibacterium sp. CH28]TGD86116.1 hypothetical protein BayCH28_18980 [Mycolicibacterium sp. CH28]
MTALLTCLVLTILLLAAFRVRAPMAGRPFADEADSDADERRINHDLDAIRTRFEEHPAWPSPGVLGERR